MSYVLAEQLGIEYIAWPIDADGFEPGREIFTIKYDTECCRVDGDHNEHTCLWDRYGPTGVTAGAYQFRATDLDARPLIK